MIKRLDEDIISKGSGEEKTMDNKEIMDSKETMDDVAFGIRQSKERQHGLDILRSLSMMMIVVLHFLGKGRLLPEWTDGNMELTGIIAWLLEAFCIVAVNVYMLISGYFLSTQEFKWSRLIKLVCQVWCYSVIVGVACAMLGLVKETAVDTYYYSRLIFPISMEHYWFMTAYVFMFALLPFIGPAINALSKEKYRTALIVLFIAFCVIKSLLPIKLDTDRKGYDCIWYLCVFLFAGYIRKFGSKIFDSIKLGILMYISGVMLIFAEAYALKFVYLKTGSLSYILGISYQYNHLFNLMAALGLFIVFKNIKANNAIGKFASFLAPYTLGVYLLHENLGLRYTWQNLLGADRVTGVASLLGRTALAVLVVFTTGILIDMVRKAIFDLAEKRLKENK